MRIRERRADSRLESIRFARRCSMSARMSSSVPDAAAMAMAAAVESEPVLPLPLEDAIHHQASKQASRDSLLSFVVVARSKDGLPATD